MKVAFAKAKYYNWIAKIVAWGCKGSFHHVELVFSNGESYSSSAMDGGVRFKKIDFSNAYKWQFIELYWVTEEQEKAMYEEAKRHVGKPYDWVGIFLNEILNLNMNDSKSFWCSEIVAYILGIIPDKLNPVELYDILVHEYYIRRVTND